MERQTEEGIEVVISHAPAWRPGEGWRIGETPALRVGDDESLGADYIFSGVSGATQVPDGRVVIADRHAAELRFFDADGSLVQVAGRQGEGPGEFAWIFNLLRCDENALHPVGGEPSISVFDFNGSFRRRFYPMQQTGFAIDYSFVCDRDGRLLVADRNPDPGFATEGLYRTTANLFVLDAASDGAVIADLGSFPMQQRFAGAGGSSRHPLGKQTSFAIHDGLTYIGTADEYDITVLDEAGTPVRRIRRDVQPATLDDRAAERYLETWVETVHPEDRSLMLRRFSGAEHPEAYPAYSRLLVDALGHLWVEAFPRDRRSPSTWSVFGPEGIWLGDLQMPPNFHALEIGDDYVLGRFTGELEQESVRLYALER